MMTKATRRAARPPRNVNGRRAQARADELRRRHQLNINNPQHVLRDGTASEASKVIRTQKLERDQARQERQRDRYRHLLSLGLTGQHAAEIVAAELGTRKSFDRAVEEVHEIVKDDPVVRVINGLFPGRGNRSKILPVIYLFARAMRLGGEQLVMSGEDECTIDVEPDLGSIKVSRARPSNSRNSGDYSFPLDISEGKLLDQNREQRLQQLAAKPSSYTDQTPEVMAGLTEIYDRMKRTGVLDQIFAEDGWIESGYNLNPNNRGKLT